MFDCTEHNPLQNTSITFQPEEYVHCCEPCRKHGIWSPGTLNAHLKTLGILLIYKLTATKHRMGKKMTETKHKLIISNFDGMLDEAYFQLLSDKKIMSFLQKDRFYKIADKYLLAIVLIYFKRGGIKIEEFNRQNFFLSLYLAHDIEEHTDIPKITMLAWVLGKNLKEKCRNFLRKWDRFLQQIIYRAVVSKSECDELMGQHNPSHWAWLKDRSEDPESAIGSHEIPKEDKMTSSPSSQCAVSVKQHQRKRKEMDEVVMLACLSNRLWYTGRLVAREQGVLPRVTNLPVYQSPKHTQRDSNITTGDEEKEIKPCKVSTPI
uniref:Uncharacterized protein n=1 Tax=Xenopus tropicalis TaxID=8364 RepID=A0A6I8SW11_XENTR